MKASDEKLMAPERESSMSRGTQNALSSKGSRLSPLLVSWVMNRRRWEYHAIPTVGAFICMTQSCPALEIIKGKWSLRKQNIILCGLMERTPKRKFPINLDGVSFFFVCVQHLYIYNHSRKECEGTTVADQWATACSTVFAFPLSVSPSMAPCEIREMLKKQTNKRPFKSQLHGLLNRGNQELGVKTAKQILLGLSFLHSTFPPTPLVQRNK